MHACTLIFRSLFFSAWQCLFFVSFFFRTAMCIVPLFVSLIAMNSVRRTDGVSLCQRKTMCCVFKEPKGLLNVLTKSIHCVGNVCCLSTSPHGLLTTALQRCNYIFVFASEVRFF